jgi:hypothetical protein
MRQSDVRPSRGGRAEDCSNTVETSALVDVVEVSKPSLVWETDELVLVLVLDADVDTASELLDDVGRDDALESGVPRGVVLEELPPPSMYISSACTTGGRSLSTR